MAKYYVPVSDNEKRKLEYDVHRLIVTRDPKHTNFAEVCWFQLVERLLACVLGLPTAFHGVKMPDCINIC